MDLEKVINKVSDFHKKNKFKFRKLLIDYKNKDRKREVLDTPLIENISQDEIFQSLELIQTCYREIDDISYLSDKEVDNVAILEQVVVAWFQQAYSHRYELKLPESFLNKVKSKLNNREFSEKICLYTKFIDDEIEYGGGEGRSYDHYLTSRYTSQTNRYATSFDYENILWCCNDLLKEYDKNRLENNKSIVMNYVIQNKPIEWGVDKVFEELNEIYNNLCLMEKNGISKRPIGTTKEEKRKSYSTGNYYLTEEQKEIKNKCDLEIAKRKKAIDDWVKNLERNNTVFNMVMDSKNEQQYFSEEFISNFNNLAQKILKDFANKYNYHRQDEIGIYGIINNISSLIVSQHQAQDILKAKEMSEDDSIALLNKLNNLLLSKSKPKDNYYETQRMIYILQNYLLEHSDFSRNFIKNFDKLVNVQIDKKIHKESWYWREQYIPLDKWRELSGYFLEVMYQIDEKLSRYRKQERVVGYDGNHYANSVKSSNDCYQISNKYFDLSYPKFLD